MDADSLTESYPDYEGQVSYIESVPAKDADHVSPDEVLPDRIAPFLPFDLYTHQARALEHLDNGEDVCITTSTSSGKTMVYALHIARQHIQDPDSTAMLVYPTKALSRDQYQELSEFYDRLDLDIEVGVYDGDVDRKEKDRVREECDVVITNFAGLNYYMAYHQSWSRFFRNLQALVIDESHMYTGIMGMHVAWIIRRLLRIVRNRRYASSPQMILTSATIGNPKEHAKNLTSRDVTVVDRDGSPHGERDILVWNPPTYYDSGEEGVRRKSSHREAAKVTAHMIQEDKQTLLFVPSRRLSELCAQWTEEVLEDEYYDYDASVEPYHAGHTKEERREVEEALKRGEMDAVVTTSALEVGIDVGSVDATVLDGYPGSRMSFWQQLGRSGRGNSDSITVMIAQNSSIDQYIARNPDYLFEDNVEDAVVDLDNEDIFEQHLVTAARELPLRREDERYFGDRLDDAVDEHKEEGIFDGDLEDEVEYVEDGRPEARINIYATSDSAYTIVVHPPSGDSFTLPSVDESRAFREFHEGAIYLHKGQEYRVTSLNTNKQVAHMQPTNVSYHTQASRDIDIVNIESEHQYDHPNGMTLYKGRGVVRERYPTFSKLFDSGNRESGFDTGINEALELWTDMIWIEIEDELWRTLRDMCEGPALGALHAAEHQMIAMCETVLNLSSDNIGGLSVLRHPETGNPTIFVYDGVDGGLGFSHAMYHELGPIAEAAKNVIDNCACNAQQGCPACVMSPMCGSDNEPLDTTGAAYLARQIFDIPYEK